MQPSERPDGSVLHDAHTGLDSRTASSQTTELFGKTLIARAARSNTGLLI